MYLYTCPYCNQCFSNKNKGKKYCSRSCYWSALRAGVEVKECGSCGTVLRRGGDNFSRNKYCGRSCFYKAVREGRVTLRHTPIELATRECECCGTIFQFPRHNKTLSSKRYCSQKCHGQAAKVPIGTERIRPTRSGGREWFVKTGCSRKGWERKAKLVMESVLGRKLNRTELGWIVFVDGNRLNCSIDNLMYRDLSRLRVCIDCGSVKVYRGEIYEKIQRCQSCSRAHEATGERWTEERRKVCAKQVKERMSSPEAKKKIGASSKAYHDRSKRDPVLREKWQEKFFRAWETRRRNALLRATQHSNEDES